jgi:putative protease
MEKDEIGKVSHFFSKINVAIVDLTSTLKVGDKISIEGPATSFEQIVDSMQIEHENVEEAKKGQSIGLKVTDKVREKDVVYKITE